MVTFSVFESDGRKAYIQDSKAFIFSLVNQENNSFKATRTCESDGPALIVCPES